MWARNLIRNAEEQILRLWWLSGGGRGRLFCGNFRASRLNYTMLFAVVLLPRNTTHRQKERETNPSFSDASFFYSPPTSTSFDGKAAISALFRIVGRIKLFLPLAFLLVKIIK